MAKPHLKPTVNELYGDAYARPVTVAESASYAAASHEDQALVGWYPSSGSADSDLLDELDTIVPRARDLDRNSGYVVGARQAHTDSIIGHQLGINPNPDRRALGWTVEQADEWSQNVSLQFESWFNNPLEIDATGMQTGRELTIQAIAGWFMNGDHAALPTWRVFPGQRWSTKIQAIEADRIDTPSSMAAQTRNIRRGIEYDRQGAIRAIWVRKTHPGDDTGVFGAGYSISDQFKRIPILTQWGRRRVIFLLNKERVGQSRGRPLVTAIMRELRMASHYTRTELQSTIATSLISGVLKSALDPDTAQSIFGSMDAQAADEWWRASFAKYAPKLKSGAILQLPLGADFESHNPNRPNTAFDAFMHSVLTHISTGLGISYEVLAKDFSRTNYSSARATMLEVWRYFNGKRAWIEENWLNPIFELWLEEAVNAGVVDAPNFYELRFAYSRLSRWTMAGRGWVDPMKEAGGAALRRRSRITSLKHECAEQGLDWREVIDQTQIEEDYMRKKGIDPMLAESQQVTTDSLDVANDQEQDQGQETDDEQQTEDEQDSEEQS